MASRPVDYKMCRPQGQQSHKHIDTTGKGAKKLQAFHFAVAELVIQQQKMYILGLLYKCIANSAHAAKPALGTIIHILYRKHGLYAANYELNRKRKLYCAGTKQNA